jgi:hypothetical protein
MKPLHDALDASTRLTAEDFNTTINARDLSGNEKCRMKICRLEVDSPSLPPTQSERRHCGCGQCIAELIGVSEVPALATGCPPLCEGCGEPKLYRGREATSLVCCSACWKKLPKWMREASMNGGGMLWENRIAVTLRWMRETTS